MEKKLFSTDTAQSASHHVGQSPKPCAGAVGSLRKAKIMMDFWLLMVNTVF